jgi:hypothetical protein
MQELALLTEEGSFDLVLTDYRMAESTAVIAEK